MKPSRAISYDPFGALRERRHKEDLKVRRAAAKEARKHKPGIVIQGKRYRPGPEGGRALDRDMQRAAAKAARGKK